MIINSLHIVDFGKFTGEMEINDIDSRIALFYGPNESGKTTLFNLIKTLFYGFSPATSDAHPYSSWKNGRIEFTGKLTDNSGEKVVVYRRLTSYPDGRCMIGDKNIILRNKTLPYAEQISKEIYNKIYSLRVEDLIEIQGKAWEEVEDKLLANYSTDLIRNTREVLRDIKKECDEIWRKNRRANTKVKDLEEKIKELKKLKKKKYEDEMEIRRLDAEINNINSEIQRLNNERLEKNTLLKKAKRLKPLKELLDEIKDLEENQKKEALSLPRNIREKLEELQDNLNILKNDKNNKEGLLQEKKDSIYKFTKEDDSILLNKSKINTMEKEYSNLEGLRDNILRIKDEIRKLKDKIAYDSNGILVEDWNPNIRKKFEELKKAELQILVNNFRESKGELKEKEKELQRRQASNNNFEIKLSKAYILSLMAGFLLIFTGLFLNNNILKYIGAGGAFYGITGIINYYSMKRNYNRNLDGIQRIKELEKQIEMLKKDFEEKRTKLIEYLKGIPISQLSIDNMDDMFLPNIFKIMDELYNLKEKEKDLSDLEDAYLEKKKMINDFLSNFSFETSYVREEEKIALLKEKVADLESKRILNEKIERDIIQIEREIKNLKDKIMDISSTLNKYKKELEKIGDKDLKNGLQIVEENYRLNDRLEVLKDKLKNWDNLNSLIREIEESGYNKLNFTDHEISEAENKLDDINKRLSNLEAEKVRAEEKINQLKNNITIDEIDSKLLYMEEELRTAYKKRDRLMVLSEIIRFADQKFREENQPDVLKNASKYFEIMTNGKYTDIYIEDTGEERLIMVKERKKNVAQRVLDTFSKGTLNQLYLALRLSLIDHLDKNSEPLPISFDELLVNWDGERLKSSLGLLEEISKRRQVFIFTCHDWMAEKIEKHFLIKRKVL